MVSLPDSALPGFPSTSSLSPLPTIQLGITRTWGLAVPPALPQKDSGPPTYFYIPRLHSWQDEEWLILSPFLVGRLCTRHCVRHMPPRANRPRGRAEENTDSYKTGCVQGRDQAQEDTQGLGNTPNPGTPHLYPELKYQLVLLGVGLIVEKVFWVQRVVS